MLSIKSRKTTKKQLETIKTFIKKKNKKRGNMVLNVTKISQNMRKSNWLKLKKIL